MQDEKNATPKPKKKAAKRTGRPPFQATDEQRYSVGLMAAIGLPQDQIAAALEISPPTLRKHFKLELATGRTRTITKVADSLVRQALAGNITAAIFYLKTQAGWKESQRVEVEEVTGERVESPDRALSEAATALRRAGYTN